MYSNDINFFCIRYQLFRFLIDKFIELVKQRFDLIGALLYQFEISFLVLEHMQIGLLGHSVDLYLGF